MCVALLFFKEPPESGVERKGEAKKKPRRVYVSRRYEEEMLILHAGVLSHNQSTEPCRDKCCAAKSHLKEAAGWLLRFNVADEYHLSKRM
jgi:hypothetical protein